MKKTCPRATNLTVNPYERIVCCALSRARLLLGWLCSSHNVRLAIRGIQRFYSIRSMVIPASPEFKHKHTREVQVASVNSKVLFLQPSYFSLNKPCYVIAYGEVSSRTTILVCRLRDSRTGSGLVACLQKGNDGYLLFRSRFS